MLKVLRLSTSTLPFRSNSTAARRGQRQPPEMILLGHLAELLMLHDLEHPEGDRQRREENGNDVLKPGEPHGEAAAVLRHHYGCCRHIRLSAVRSPQSAVRMFRMKPDRGLRDAGTES
jgi:hypothetical protein